MMVPISGDMMTNRELFILIKDKLVMADDLDEHTARFEALQLFDHAVADGRKQLALFPQDTVDKDSCDKLIEFALRRAEGEPLQYILGKWEFYGLNFEVGKGVLIPRPETELLVDLGLESVKGKKAPVIIDLCSGSGCIAVSIAVHRPDANVIAVEKSEEAFNYLIRNIKTNNVPVESVHEDVFSFKTEAADLIVCNPPYIAENELCMLQREIAWEPVMALSGGKDGLEFYKSLSGPCFAMLKDGGEIIFEIGSSQASDVTAILESTGFRDITTVKDLEKNDRAVKGIRRL